MIYKLSSVGKFWIAVRLRTSDSIIVFFSSVANMKMFKKLLVLWLSCNILLIEAVKVRNSRKLISKREATLSSAKNKREKRAARGSCSEFTPCRCRSKRTVACTKADCMQRLPSFETTRQEGARMRTLLVTRYVMTVFFYVFVTAFLRKVIFSVVACHLLSICSSVLSDRRMRQFTIVIYF